MNLIVCHPLSMRSPVLYDGPADSSAVLVGAQRNVCCAFGIPQLPPQSGDRPWLYLSSDDVHLALRSAERDLSLIGAWTFISGYLLDIASKKAA